MTISQGIRHCLILPVHHHSLYYYILDGHNQIQNAPEISNSLRQTSNTKTYLILYNSPMGAGLLDTHRPINAMSKDDVNVTVHTS